MESGRPMETAAIAGALLAGIFLFAWMVVQADAVPAEYRNTSPGYGWSWDFDWVTALRDAGKFGEEPWPWPAKDAGGGHFVLPLNQPLVTGGLELTYRGILESGEFRLDVVVRSLDAKVAYPRDISGREAVEGFTITDQGFRAEKITPLYLRLYAAAPQ